MKALITGSEGFVGPYLRAELKAYGYEVKGLDIVSAPETFQADLMDSLAIQNILSLFQPDVVFHLAALADVGKSWREPQLAVKLNLMASVNLLEALRKLCPETKLILVGSSDQYGHLRNAGECVREDMNTVPGSPYAVSKKAQEEMACLYVKAYHMKICMTRSFNHGGAGQKTGFIIPDFASGIVQIERGISNFLLVGNLSAKRDFTHVKDMVRAYRLLAEKGRPGEIYNVGSGVAWSAQHILNELCKMASCPIPVKQDPSRMRPSDTPVICCDHEKLSSDTGWHPELSLNDILADTLTYYRNLKEAF